MEVKLIPGQSLVRATPVPRGSRCLAMCSGKMATRWRRKDGLLKPGKVHFLPNNSLDEFNTDVEMNTHSSVDQSILALFEDASVSEDKEAAEDSAKLLSAFTEMLESVEDDDDTLSPFSSLPETSLLMSQDNAKEISNTSGQDEWSKTEGTANVETGALLHPINTKVDMEVEVFTSLSLVNLVKIMHPYCLKLQVGMNLRRQEVWKYERPSEDIDEEINVVSDDEGSAEKTVKIQENTCKPLKSKKRVSFGAVQVTSFDQDSQTSGISSSVANHSPKALDNHTELQATNSSENDQLSDVEQQKAEGKRKLLSLQQYRQLRQKRQPLVEKQGNYMTKWPLVTVPPKELTPILGVNGQKQTHFNSVASRNSKDISTQIKASKLSNDLPQKAKRSRLVGKTQPVVPLPNLPASVPKKSTILSSDPPNPVLVPLPVQHPPTNEAALEKSFHNQQPPQEASKTNSHTTLEKNNQSVIPEENNPPSMPYEPPTPVSTPVKEMTPETAFSQNLPLCPYSGIEASDLTSLLEQFEETQAKEEGECERPLRVNSSKLECTASNSIPQTDSVSSSDPTLPRSCTEELSDTALLHSGPDLKIPELLGTEVILSSTQEQSIRRKVPPVKAIQIIDPRPMPFKRTHASPAESTYTSPHVYSAILSDHDYCTVLEGNKTTQVNQSDFVEIRQANPNIPVLCPKQIVEAVNSENSVDKVTKQDQTKPPTEQSTLSTDNSQKTCDIRLDQCMVLPTPPPSPPCRVRDRASPPPPRGRDQRRYRTRSCSSDSTSSSCSSCSSSSSSRSRSPKRQKRHYRSSDSSSCSSSSSRSTSRSPPRRKRRFSRTRFSRSGSSSWSESRSRSRSRSYSPSQRVKRSRLEGVCSRESRKLRREQELRAQKLRAIDERRVVYVGRIRRTMTHEELRERFAQFGDVESVSLHFRDRGDHYGFVTFYNMEDAFAAIDNGGKLRSLMNFLLIFALAEEGSSVIQIICKSGQRRLSVRSRFEEADFDLLLKQAQKGLKR
ncbi:hypothetical protein WMY93_006647 [Mugilogobius chulae]|uniref:RRM domain-containing protein n=1 Tax=Mugilogobius chulae TaxID=88201 RepID=A0AAW0PMY8_9GOBI